MFVAVRYAVCGAERIRVSWVWRWSGTSEEEEEFWVFELKPLPENQKISEFSAVVLGFGRETVR